MSRLSVTPVILSGGAGSRLWPLSREARPKQFHTLLGRETLLASTIARVTGDTTRPHFHPYLLLGSAAHAGDLERHARRNPECGGILLEPSVRNTAAAIAAATCHVAERQTDDPIIVLPSDAHIADVEAFHKSICCAIACADDESIVTFGIVPDRPETGYGYIKRGGQSGPGYICEAFIEKPDQATADSYLADGRYFWNGGIFLFRPSVMLAAFERHAPDILEAARRSVQLAQRAGLTVALDGQAFAACRSQSIDYAVMEKVERVKVVAADMGWSDLGSWQQIHDLADKDSDGNCFSGKVAAKNTAQTFVLSQQRTIGLVGVKDLIVVDTADSLLIAGRNATQDVKSIVETLKSGRHSEARHLPDFSRIIWPLETQVDLIKSWLFKKAYPYWTETGVDWERGGVHERMALDGSPKLNDDYKRVRVLARQIAAFAQAKLLGYDGRADRALSHSLEALFNFAKHQDGGWVHLLNPDGSVKDAARDTYDQGFVLYALAMAYRATGEAGLKSSANETYAFITEQLADERAGGFFEGLPTRLPRRSNPHMHLLEAMLACHRAFDGGPYLETAARIVTLFKSKFLDEETWALGEFFKEDWQPADGSPGQRVEPGHMYEWMWLLATFEKMSGQDLSQPLWRLLTFAEAHGRNAETGRVYDAIAKDGSVLESTSRTWPQTEALKALVVMKERGQGGLEHRIN